MQQIKFTGLALIGTYMGVRQRQITNRATGEVSTIAEAGFSTLLDNGFGGVTEEITMVSLSKAQMVDGTSSKLQPFIGKSIMVPVWVRSYPLQGGKAGQNIYLSNDWHSQVVVLQEPAAKAS
ncbi:DNA-binding protein [Rheinheimera sp.]|uniref:DNA-binding protein n=1 Tax=Rheinheimera sp. TaxID=1869214 RepID=UPI00307CF811